MSEDISEIKRRLDLVDHIGASVTLKKQGRNFAACCPFHQENTPSFVVFPDRQTWRCFGACATGGDVFTFVMKVEGTEFPGALKTLAERAGVALPERRVSDGPRNPILDVNDAALRFFRDALQSDRGSLARAYVDQRGFSEESLLRWGIGYAPSTGNDVLKRLEALGFSEDLLVNSGIATRSDTGQVRDMFRDPWSRWRELPPPRRRPRNPEGGACSSGPPAGRSTDRRRASA